ncbi:MAG: S-layer homology domain-containing protein [Acidimicrobiia bacterium]|nr:S-layer homology domain-containing protein [Acidimicrobiia bacterium]
MRKTKWAALAVAAVMTVATVVVAQSGFPDVPDDHPHRAAIDWSRDIGAFQGYPDGTFRPDQKITAEHATIVFDRVYPDGVSRAEFAALLYVGSNLLGEAPTVTTTTVPPTTTTTSTTVAPAEDGYSHAHCARIRNDGGCDRRFRPTYHSCHFHADTVPRHNSGKHYGTTPSDNC